MGPVVGVWRMPIVSGRVCEFPSMGINGQISPCAIGVDALRRLISVFELLGAYVGGGQAMDTRSSGKYGPYVGGAPNRNG